METISRLLSPFWLRVLIMKSGKNVLVKRTIHRKGLRILL